LGLLIKGKRKRSIAQADGCIVIGERFDVSVNAEVGRSIDNLPVLVAIDRTGDQKIASSIHVLHKGAPPSFSQRLR
jgi:hypothetical protein